MKLKEQYNIFCKENQIENDEVIWQFFAPHLKKSIDTSIDIPKDKIKRFNELWPKMTLPTGALARCSEKELESAFKAFFKEYPKLNDWGKIFDAAKKYLNQREAEKWEYTRRSKYFIRRELKDKTVEFLLADYYQQLDIIEEQISNKPTPYMLRVK